MAKSKVEIPVKVVGKGAAKKDLGEVGGAIEGVGTAGSKQARGTKEATRASREHAKAQDRVKKSTKGAAKEVGTFDDAARTAVRRGLDAIVPGLGNMVSMVNDVAKGLGRVTVGLLAFAGLGAALAGIAFLFQKIAEKARQAEDAIKRVAAAERKRAQERLTGRQRLAVEGARIGIGAKAPQLQQLFDELKEEFVGVPEDILTQIALASVRGGLDQKGQDAFFASLIKHGLKGPELTGGPRDQAAIHKFAGQGFDPLAYQALAGFLAGVAPRSKSQAFEVVAGEIRPKIPDVSDAGFEAAIRIAKSGKQLRSKQFVDEESGKGVMFGGQVPGDVTDDPQRIMRLAEEMREAMGEQLSRASTLSRIGGNITINVITNQTSIAQQHNRVDTFAEPTFERTPEMPGGF